MKKSIATWFLFFSLTQLSHATLLGDGVSIVSLKVIYQSTILNPLNIVGSDYSRIVEEYSEEFPNVAALDVYGDKFSLVNPAIDITDNSIRINFINAGEGRFLPGYKNGYVFTFETYNRLPISAILETNIVGLTESDITVGNPIGNQIFINMEGVSFDGFSYVYISLY